MENLYCFVGPLGVARDLWSDWSYQPCSSTQCTCVIVHACAQRVRCDDRAYTIDRARSSAGCDFKKYPAWENAIKIPKMDLQN